MIPFNEEPTSRFLQPIIPLIDITKNDPIYKPFAYIVHLLDRKDQFNSISISIKSIGKTVQSLCDLSDKEWALIPLPIMLKVYVKFLIEETFPSSPLKNEEDSSTSSENSQEDDSNENNKEEDEKEKKGKKLQLRNIIMEMTKIYEKRDLPLEEDIHEFYESLKLEDSGLLDKKGREEYLEGLDLHIFEDSEHSEDSSDNYTIGSSKESLSDSQKLKRKKKKKGIEVVETLEDLKKSKTELEEKIKMLKKENEEKDINFNKFAKFMSLEIVQAYVRGFRDKDGEMTTKENADILWEKIENFGVERELGEKILDFMGMEENDVAKGAKEKKSEIKLCVICMSEEADFILMDCMHLCLCETCSKNLMKKKLIFAAKCPICKAKVSNVKRIYI